MTIRREQWDKCQEEEVREGSALCARMVLDLNSINIRGSGKVLCAQCGCARNVII